MKNLFKEYEGWLTDNKVFYEHLKKHESVLYHRLQPVYDVLVYLYHEYNDKHENQDEDLEKIFQVGLEYLNMQFFTCKIYYEKSFDKDFHEFLMYDKVVNFILFVEDLKYELVEKKLDYDKEKLNDLSDYLEDIVTNKKEIPENLNLYVDSIIYKSIEEDNYHFTGIIDIFVEIGNTLGLNFDDEIDYILGEDIYNE